MTVSVEFAIIPGFVRGMKVPNVDFQLLKNQDKDGLLPANMCKEFTYRGVPAFKSMECYTLASKTWNLNP